MKEKMLILGLTGSIGMGKSTTAKMFRDEGVLVWDADEAVVKAYSPGGAAVEKIEQLCPLAVPNSNSGVDRNTLRSSLDEDQGLLDELERIVHPIVAGDREKFLAEARANRERIVVVDVPLLYEMGAEESVDSVVVATVSEDIQRQRVLARANMTEERFIRILSRQIPNEEKKARADYIIDTTTMENAREAVRSLLAELGAGKDC